MGEPRPRSEGRAQPQRGELREDFVPAGGGKCVALAVPEGYSWLSDVPGAPARKWHQWGSCSRNETTFGGSCAFSREPAPCALQRPYFIEQQGQTRTTAGPCVGSMA